MCREPGKQSPAFNEKHIMKKQKNPPPRVPIQASENLTLEDKADQVEAALAKNHKCQAKKDRHMEGQQAHLKTAAPRSCEPAKKKRNCAGKSKRKLK